jgi:hypothetical protein
MALAASALYTLTLREQRQFDTCHADRLVSPRVSRLSCRSSGPSGRRAVSPQSVQSSMPSRGPSRRGGARRTTTGPCRPGGRVHEGHALSAPATGRNPPPRVGTPEVSGRLGVASTRFPRAPGAPGAPGHQGGTAGRRDTPRQGNQGRRFGTTNASITTHGTHGTRRDKWQLSRADIASNGQEWYGQDSIGHRAHDGTRDTGIQTHVVQFASA